MRILLVDDDDFLLDMYATKFSEGGYEVDSAKNAGTALEKLKAGEKYDVMLFDIVMPGLSGLDLLKAVKKEKLGNGMKCIILSNQGERDDINAGMELGADGYIVKATLIPSEVVSKVGEYLT